MSETPEGLRFLPGFLSEEEERVWVDVKTLRYSLSLRTVKTRPAGSVAPPPA
ncbi:MAG TPA: hypothetical protein VFZ09_10560 [Archangium sp.]|uniref:hypothetical protein n=1 Tax=Archangium sp. TaxID=1872627 RepID=UPI002E2F19C0|nr:hypothetical protein [Archangium sp.]HEX5746679.1 hypothetical protein [Archangium sp.]